METNREIESVEVHGRTGLDLSEGRLAVGTKIKKIRESLDSLGELVYLFQARAGSGPWMDQRSYCNPRI